MLATSTILLSSIIGFVNVSENIVIEKPVAFQSSSVLIDDALLQNDVLLQEEAPHEQLFAQFGQSRLTPAEKAKRDSEKRRQAARERMEKYRKESAKRRAESQKRLDDIRKRNTMQSKIPRKTEPAHNRVIKKTNQQLQQSSTNAAKSINRANDQMNQSIQKQNRSLDQMFQNLDRQAQQTRDLANRPVHTRSTVRNNTDSNDDSASSSSEPTPRYGLILRSVIKILLFLGAGSLFFIRKIFGN